MATTQGIVYRNYNSSDTTNQTVDLGTHDPFPQPLWDPPTGYAFLEWNSKRDGSGTGFQPGQEFDFTAETFYAIWYIPPKYYSVKTSDLTALANIINSRNDTTTQLEWPQGYIDAIGIIGTFTFIIEGTTYRAKDNMTWAEWIASDYNINNFGNAYGNYITFPNSNSTCIADSNYSHRILKSETIIASANYVIVDTTGPI